VIAMVNAFRWIIFVIGLAVVIGSIMVTSVGGLRIEINSPSDGDTVSTDKTTVYGCAIMDPSGAVVESVIVTVNDHPHLAYGTPSWHSELISLQPGRNEITAVAIDESGKSVTTPTIYVNYEPNTTHTNGPSPATPPTTTTISNGGYRPTPAPTPTPTGSISITTKPSEAKIFWDGVFKGNTTIALEDVIGNHRVKISKEGFKNVTSRISLYEDMPITRHFVLEPINGSIAVSSTPSGAIVYLDNDNMSVITPCMLNVNVGEHTLKLTKSDYFDETENVSVSVDKIEYVHVNLTGYGSISISSNPDGAYVYLDNNYMNKTCELSEVVVGQHTIKLTKSGYFNVTKNVSVSVGITHPVRINLTECCSISISTNPSGAKVYLDGNYKGETPKNISKVPQGNHSIEFKKLDYVSVTKNIQVSAGETTSVRVRLNCTFICKCTKILTYSVGMPFWAILILTCAALVTIIKALK
jgi:hypothetical protein